MKNNLNSFLLQSVQSVQSVQAQKAGMDFSCFIRPLPVDNNYGEQRHHRVPVTTYTLQWHSGLLQSFSLVEAGLWRVDFGPRYAKDAEPHYLYTTGSY